MFALNTTGLPNALAWIEFHTLQQILIVHKGNATGNGPVKGFSEDNIIFSIVIANVKREYDS